MEKIQVEEYMCVSKKLNVKLKNKVIAKCQTKITRFRLREKADTLKENEKWCISAYTIRKSKEKQAVRDMMYQKYCVLIRIGL